MMKYRIDYTIYVVMKEKIFEYPSFSPLLLLIYSGTAFLYNLGYSLVGYTNTNAQK